MTSIVLRWQQFVAVCLLGVILLNIVAWALGFHETDVLMKVAHIVGVPWVCFHGVRQIVNREWGSDFLAIISIVTAIYMGEYLASAIVMLMLSGGQVLENFAMSKASRALKALAQRLPEVAHRRQGSRIEDIALSKIQIDDEILIYPHEASPVDGIVVEGYGHMDESYLTGEPYKLSKTPGSYVLSGAINGENLLVTRVTARAQDSRYAKIMAVMTDATQRRPRVRRIADTFGQWFSPFVLIMGGITWWMTGESIRFLSVIIVATPCPLIIAIPVAIISAISWAAQRGIMIKDPKVLEQLPRCRTAIFDKTGTLTYGAPELAHIHMAPGWPMRDVIQKVASLEQFSKHPLSQAILQYAQEHGISLTPVDQISELPGQGLSGVIQGHHVHITHRVYLEAHVSNLLPFLPKDTEQLECIILVDGVYAATLQFQDTLRKDGMSFVSHLLPLHHIDRLLIVSGDRRSAVKSLADKLGITEIYAHQTPEQKVQIVAQETAKAPTLFMGDGINDAPALAVATVGIAFGHHNEVIGEAADVVILENTLIKVDELFHMSQETLRIIFQSALGGLFLSAVGMVLASFGYVTPVMGAIAQECIDALAVLNALRLVWRKDVNVDMSSN